MYQFEESYVNKQLVNDPSCYNLIIGGKSKKTYKELSKISIYKRDNDSFKQKVKHGMYKYWSTGDIEAKKKKQSNVNKKYWSTGDVEAKKKKHSQTQKNSYLNNPERRKKIKDKLNERWNGIDGELNRKKLSYSLKNSQKKKQYNKKIKESKIYALYNNPDFKKRWKKVYEQDMDVICELLKYSNLPDCFIICKLFNKNVHIKRIIAYYKHLGILPEQKSIQKKNRFLKFDNLDNKGHKDGGSKKTIFTQEIKYNFIFLYEDFFKQWKIIVDLMKNDKISDSMITNLQKYEKTIPNYYQVIEYFKEIGVIEDIETILIRTNKIVGNKKFTVPAKKTKFKINYKNIKNYLIDKEFNTYGIDDNGNTFQKGKFELEINGKKHSLQCF